MVLLLGAIDEQTKEETFEGESVTHQLTAAEFSWFLRSSSQRSRWANSWLKSKWTIKGFDVPYVAQVTSSFHLILLPHFTTTAASLDSLAHFLLGSFIWTPVTTAFHLQVWPFILFRHARTCFLWNLTFPSLSRKECRTKPSTHHHVFCIPFQASLFRVLEISENKC